MAPNQNTVANSTIKMDSRKFLSALNDSAQARVTFFNEKIEEMGRLAGKNWQLSALRAKDLLFEDVNTGTFYAANHSKTQGRISINSIREIQITEGEKAELFEESCLRLVNAIEENDQSKMASAFGRMKAQRFSSKAIPSSGMVRTRDGVVRSINTSNDNFNETAKDKIVAAIVESLQDKVIVENGTVTAGYFNNGERFKLPVTKWGTRKLVARQMREAATNAYKSAGFQDRILNLANMISENKIEDAVHAVVPFLMEMEEFTLLNRKQVNTLVENALAAKGIFNQQLCGDTATLFYKTNAKVSRSKIVKEWKAIARNAEHPILAENVQILSEAKNFEGAYEKFLHLVFEAISNRQVAAESLATTLQVLRDKTPKIKESHDLSSKLMGLISRLKKPDFDDAAIYEAEDLIATIQEELSANESLKDFDMMPGDDSAGGGFGTSEPSVDIGDGGKGQPIININSPLIQIGGSSGTTPETDEVDDSIPPSEDEELDAMFGDEPLDQQAQAGGPPPAGGAPAPPPAAPGAGAPPAAPAAPRLESRWGRKSVNESRPVHYEMNRNADDLDDEFEDEEDQVNESSDPYAYRTKNKSNFVMDYGAPVIQDAADLNKVTNLMRRLAVEHNLTGNALAENLDDMARASIEAIGLRIPGARLESAVEQAVSNFIEEAKAPFPGAAKPFGSKDDDDDCDEYGDEECDDESKPWDDEGVAEDQYKSPSQKGMGYGRAALQRMKKKGRVASEDKITWLESQDDALLGQINGVNFILDHGGGDATVQPVILSEDGMSVEIPVPARLVKGALAAAGIVKGNYNPFTKWLSESVEQLRPVSNEEDQALNEAMVSIKTNKDGSLDLHVSGDVDIVDDEAEEMQVVDSIEPESPEPEEVTSDLPDDEMPDFEKNDSSDDDEDSDDEVEEVEEVEDGDEDEEGLAEDTDITAPGQSGYNKIAKEDPRTTPKHKISKPSNPNKMDGIGPDLKVDSGSGTKPPIARKGSKK